MDAPKGPQTSQPSAIDFGLYSSFLAFQSPLPVSWIAATRGLAVAPLSDGFTYVERGCGAGFALAAMAAAYPQARFIGIEPDADQAKRAEGLARQSELDNLEVRHGPLDQPDVPVADIVALSNLYSWHGPQERVSLARRALDGVKDGGFLCVQYAALPGSAVNDCAFTLLRGIAETLNGTPAERLAAALPRAAELARTGSAFFQQNPSAAELLQNMAQSAPSYAMREVFRTQPHSLYFSEVHGELAGLGLAYAGNGQLEANYTELSIPVGMRAVLDHAATPEARELLMDFARNSAARADLYFKGAAPKADAKHDLAEVLSPFTIARFGKGDETLARQQVAQQTGVDFTAGVYTDLLHVLDEGPATIEAVTDHASLRKHARPRLLRAIQFAVAVRMIHLIRTGTSLTIGDVPSQFAMNGALNKGLLEGNLDNPEVVPFSSPVTGVRVLLTMQDRWMLHAMLGGAVEPILERMKARGFELKDKDGKPATPESFRATITKDLEAYRQRNGRALMCLGVLTAA